MASINVQPSFLDLSFYAGDGLSFKLTCTNPDDSPLPITGEVESQIRLDRVTDIDPLVEFTVDLTDADPDGVVIFSLTGVQTASLIAAGKAGKFQGVWDAQWTPTGSEPRTLCQGKVECLADVTR